MDCAEPPCPAVPNHHDDEEDEMRVRMLAKISGTRDGKDWPDVDGEIDVPDDEAAQLCNLGMAVPVVEPEPEHETETEATAATSEAPASEVPATPTTDQATKPTPRRRSRAAG